MQQLSPQDAMFAHMERPNTPLQLGWLNIYDPATAPGGKVRFKQILQHVEDRLHTVRFFRQKLVFVPGNLDEPYWVDDPGFDLEYHVRHVRLPAPGDWRQLCILVARLFARPFDFARPLWEFYVIEGLDGVAGYPDGCFALLAKMHHAAVDGLSGVDVTTALHTPGPDTPPPQPGHWQPEAEPTPVDLLGRAYLANLRRPQKMIRIVADALPGFRRVREAIEAGELRKPEKKTVPRTRFSGPAGPHRVVEARRFRLEEVKPLRALAPGSTINDIMLALVSGTLRKYLLAKGELPETTMIATCPISVRTEAERGQLGNKIGNMFIPLCTDVADPVERLNLIREKTANAKGMNEAVGARTLADLSQLLPGALVSLGTRVSTQIQREATANTTVTNVPGPQQPLYLAGARMLSEYVFGTILEGMGIFHAIYSYCGELTVNVVADRDKLPDPGFYAQCIEDAFEELRAAAEAAAAPAPANPAKRARGRTRSRDRIVTAPF